ncbi:MAG: hypothetical protein ACLP1E_09205 [Acidimicrobiales bacterium]
MSDNSQTVAQRPGGVGRRSTSVVLLAVGAIVTAQFLLVLMFAWSSSRAAPRDLPIAVSGPPAAARGLAHGLERTQPGAFTVAVLPDNAAARAAVTDRQVYAAICLSGTGAAVYTASEASPNVAQMLAQTVPAAIGHVLPNATVTITDLAPNPVDDPKGTAIPTALIPLTMTSIAAGAMIGLLSSGRRRQLTGLVGYAVLAGLLVTVALQGLLGGLTGSWFSNELVITLAAGSIAAVTCGLASVAGIAGILLTLLVAWFFGFAFSGATTAWQLMPAPWGQIAQYLPVGATNTGLRSVAFFDGAKAAGPLAVLAAWALAGIALTLFRQSSRQSTASPDLT